MAEYERCPLMSTEPYAGAFGMCLGKQGNTYKEVNCDYLTHGDFKKCPILKEWDDRIERMGRI